MTGPPSRRPPPSIPGYTDLEEIARGGFAVVYRATQSSIRRDVAIKVIVRVDMDGRDQQRFEQECRVLGALGWHPHIVVIFDAGFTDDSMPYIVMEHFPRGTVADRLARDGRLPWEEVLAYGVQLSGALEAAHRAGVIHRDIKPRNVLLGALGETKLSDFGIALTGDSSTRSSTGQVSGTMAHVAPEMLSGTRANVQTDIYSLASALYELLSGRAAFVRPDDDSVVPLIARISTLTPEPLTPLGVPSDLDELLQRCMAKAPQERPAIAEQLGRLLQDIQGAHGLARSELHLRQEESISPGSTPPSGVPPDGAPPDGIPPDGIAPVTATPDPSSTVISGAAGLAGITHPEAEDRTGETVILPSLPEPAPRPTVEPPPLPARAAAPPPGPPFGPPPANQTYLPPLDPNLRPGPEARPSSHGSSYRWVLVVAGVAVVGILAGVLASALLNKDDSNTFSPSQDESTSSDSGSGGDGVLSLGSETVGDVSTDGTATFQVVGPGDDVAVQVAGIGDFDPTVTVLDSSGEQLAFNDDTNGHDSEAVVFMGSGEQFTVQVRGFDGSAGSFRLDIVDAAFATTATSFFFSS